MPATCSVLRRVAIHSPTCRVSEEEQIVPKPEGEVVQKKRISQKKLKNKNNTNNN